MFNPVSIPVSGIVTASKDLTYAVDSGYLLEITVSDGHDSMVDYLQIDLTSKTRKPVVPRRFTTKLYNLHLLRSRFDC